MLSLTQNAGVAKQKFSGLDYRFHGKYRNWRTLRKTESEGSDIAHCMSETLRVSTTITARKTATAITHNKFNASPPTLLVHHQHGAQKFSASSSTLFRKTLNNTRDSSPFYYPRYNSFKWKHEKLFLKLHLMKNKKIQNSHSSMLHSHLCGFIYCLFLIHN